MHLQPHTNLGFLKTRDSEEFVYILRVELILHCDEEKTYVLGRAILRITALGRTISGRTPHTSRWNFWR